MNPRLRISPLFAVGMIVFVSSFVLILFFMSPLFNISHVIIEGNYRISDAQVLRDIGLDGATPTNVFLFNGRLAERRLLENTYFESVSISKHHLRAELSISLNERRLAGFVEFAPGQYLFIDENGLVLESSTFFTENLPIIIGLEFSRFALGQPLETSNTQSFEHMVAISQLLSRHGLQYNVFRIDVNDSQNIRLFIDELDISFGDLSHSDQKMQTIIEVLRHFEGEQIRGSLDVSDITRHAILRHLT